MSSKRILVVAPHADDAELGVGAYLHREAKRGADTFVIVVAGGSRSASHVSPASPSDREKEGAAAGNVLFVKEYRFIYAAPDSAFNTAPRGDLIAALEREIARCRPDELFIPLPSFHTDHVVTFESCITALRPHLNRRFPDRVFAYEYPGNCWGPQHVGDGLVYAPIEDADLGAKLMSLAKHKSQWASEKASLYGERGVRAMAELRGAEIGVKAAERFYMLRSVLA